MSTSVFTMSISFHSRYHCCQLVFPYSDYQVRLSKILNAKKSKIKVLREMNTEAERKKSFGSYIPEDFQRRYASVIIDLEHLNRDLQDYLTNVQKYCQEVSSNKCFYLCMLCVRLLLNTSYLTFRISHIWQSDPYLECKLAKWWVCKICNVVFCLGATGTGNKKFYLMINCIHSYRCLWNIFLLVNTCWTWLQCGNLRLCWTDVW